MQLILDQSLPAPPDAVWAFLTEPEQIARWSAIRIGALAAGDGGSPGGVGALWQGTVPLPGVGQARPFLAVLEQAEAPRRLTFRVVEGPTLRYLHGDLLLTPQGTREAHLLVELRIELGASITTWGVRQATGLWVRSLMQRGFAQLAQLVRGAPRKAYGPPVRIDESAELPALRMEAERALVLQRALADRLEQREDPRHLFSRLALYAGEAMLGACGGGLFAHPAFVLRLIPRFGELYRTNLRRYLGEEPGMPESHWRAAFVAMENRRAASFFSGERLLRSAVLGGLLNAVQAHTEEDLPRVLAEVYVHHYAARCHYARFRSDFLLSARVLRDAAERLAGRLPFRLRRAYLHVLEGLLSPGTSAKPYNVPLQQLRAFDRGERMATLLLERPAS